MDPPNTGSIAGIIGAGGNTGAVCFGLGFRQLDVKDAFYIMGFSIIASSFLSVFIFIPGHAGLICGKDDPTKQNFKLSLEGGEDAPKALDTEKAEIVTPAKAAVADFDDSEEMYA